MNNDLLAQTKVLKEQLLVKHVVIDTHVECQEKYVKLEAERYENNDLLAQTKVLKEQLLVKHVVIDTHVEYSTHDHAIKRYLYNGRKGIGFKNPSYFEKAKDLRPTLYDEKVFGLGYTLMFLTHSEEALEIEKFKRSRENKIEFAYDYENLNASYVNEKINFEDDYFQDIINPDFEKIDSLFQQTSSLKPYVLNVILEKIIIDLEDEVVSLMEKEKANLVTLESLKSKGFESSENVSSESENQTENDCFVVEKECDKEENPNVIAPGMFKLIVSQYVSPISMSKSSCESNNVEIKLKRKRHLDTFISVRRPKNSGVVWKKKGSSNISKVDLMNDLLDDNNFFIFDDESVKISPVSKMPFRKKPRDSMNVHSKSNSNKSLPRTVYCPDLSLDYRFGMFKAYDG
nr:hypothetical protein [Tanacetum cinerariifolium]